MVEPFRDPTYERSDFDLTLEDCWGGLERGVSLGWVAYAAQGYLWGCIDVEEYCHDDSPAEGNMHEVVPGKFIAFQGPKDLGGKEYHDDDRGHRCFSPAVYADIFSSDFGVAAVVRLNEAEYDGAAFEARGIRHHCLEFEDCSCPPHRVAAAFLRLAAAAPGSVAVHCKAGLGRTGTLIALWLMRSRGFSAREAMGWLRVMRPGSVIGEQQHYLCGALSSGESSDRARSSELAAEVAAGMQRRGSLRAAGSPLLGGMPASGLESLATLAIGGCSE
jgi:cell division cycle 14